MSDARRRAFNVVNPTCPTVEDILDDAVKALKAQVTEPFREALIEAYGEVIEREDEVEKLKERITELEGEVEDLKDTIATMENSKRDWAQPYGSGNAGVKIVETLT